MKKAKGLITSLNHRINRPTSVLPLDLILNNKPSKCALLILLTPCLSLSFASVFFCVSSLFPLVWHSVCTAGLAYFSFPADTNLTLFSPLEKQKSIYFFIWLCWILVAKLRISDFHCGLQDHLLRHVRSSSPDQGSNPGPLLWEHRVLATDHRKSLSMFFRKAISSWSRWLPTLGLNLKPQRWLSVQLEGHLEHTSQNRGLTKPRMLFHCSSGSLVPSADTRSGGCNCSNSKTDFSLELRLTWTCRSGIGEIEAGSPKFGALGIKRTYCLKA